MKQWLLDNLFLLITAVVALYGAVFGTVTFALRPERRRKLKVTLSHGFITHGPELGPDRLIVNVANPGSNPITVSSVLVRLPDGAHAIFPIENSEVRLPHELEPEKSFHVWEDVAVMARGLKERGYSGTVKLRGAASDAVGRYHLGKQIEFDLG